MRHYIDLWWPRIKSGVRPWVIGDYLSITRYNGRVYVILKDSRGIDKLNWRVW